MTIIKTVRDIQLKEVNGQFILTNDKQSSTYLGDATKQFLLSLDDARFWHEAKDRIAEDNFEYQVDLFSVWETLPEKLQELIEELFERLQNGGNGYTTCADMLAKFEAEGYTYNYGLDAEPFELQKINLDITN